MKTNKRTALTLALGSAVTLGLSAAPVSAAENPFSTQVLDKGYMVAEADKAKEGKCGAKAKEGKCGGAKAKEGKCGGEKAKEGKCGGKSKGDDMKAEQGKTTQEKAKAKEGKCGEGKCGGGKK